MANIDQHLFMAPGELVLASTGVTVALRPGPVRITQEVLGRANPVAMAKSIARRLKRFMVAREPAERLDPPPFDYDELCDLLPQMQSEARHVENVAGFQTQFLADAYAQQLGTAVGYIQREIPDKVAPAVVGGQRLRAPDYEIAAFRRRYCVLDRPLMVLDDLAAGWLVDDQVDALEAVFPTIYGAIKSSVMPALVEAAGGRQGWRLPYAKDLQLQVLMKESNPNGQLHAQILQRWDEKRAEESGKGPKAPGASQRRGVGDASTQQERLEAK
jgi:hypothetical protein